MSEADKQLTNLADEIATFKRLINEQVEAGVSLDVIGRAYERLAKLCRAHRSMTGGGSKVDELLGSLLQEVGVELGIGS